MIGDFVIGVSIFIVSQYILELIIKPKRKLRETSNKINYSLKFYANKLTNPYRKESENEYIEIRRILRELGCQIEIDSGNTPFLNKKNKETYREISGYLIGISNSLYEGQFNDRKSYYIKIMEILGKIKK